MKIFQTKTTKFEIGKKIYVMGVLNVTPDSFSDGGKYFSLENAVERAFEIQNQGADILDVGAQSTRPNFKNISAEEELKRLIPVLNALQNKIKIPISIDTFYPKVAEEALKYGVSIINDVTGFSEEMFELAKIYKCGCIIMHCTEKIEIKEFFNFKLTKAKSFGIDERRLCFDVGIGFGKTRAQEYYILGNIHKFKIAENALMVGVSRKRVIGECCGNPPFNERLPGTIAANSIAIFNGADIIRVHDVAEAVQSCQVAHKILSMSHENFLKN